MAMGVLMVVIGTQACCPAANSPCCGWSWGSSVGVAGSVSGEDSAGYSCGASEGPSAGALSGISEGLLPGTSDGGSPMLAVAGVHDE